MGTEKSFCTQSMQYNCHSFKIEIRIVKIQQHQHNQGSHSLQSETHEYPEKKRKEKTDHLLFATELVSLSIEGHCHASTSIIRAHALASGTPINLCVVLHTEGIEAGFRAEELLHLMKAEFITNLEKVQRKDRELLALFYRKY